MNMDKLCGLQTNYLQNNGFQLVLPRFPLVTFYSNNFIFPGVALPPVVTGNPFVDQKYAGDKPQFEDFTFRFIIDEGVSNYMELFNWINGIGFTTGHDKYTNYTNKDKHQPLGEQDAQVIILSNKSNPVGRFTFYDAFPVALSGWEFTVTDPDTNYVMGEATFAYSHFDYKQ